MKSLKKIATVVLERRSQLTHVILPGDITATLGTDGLEEAMRQRWIVPDMDLGSLKVSSDMGVVEAMTQISEAKCKVCGKDKCECDPEEGEKPAQLESLPAYGASRTAALGHSVRYMSEFAAPGSGQADKPAVAPPQPNTASNTPAKTHAVGEAVMIADNGKSFAGVIKAVQPDGTYSVSFDNGQRPSTGERYYRKEELGMVMPKPGAPQ